MSVRLATVPAGGSWQRFNPSRDRKGAETAGTALRLAPLGSFRPIDTRPAGGRGLWAHRGGGYLLCSFRDAQAVGGAWAVRAGAGPMRRAIRRHPLSWKTIDRRSVPAESLGPGLSDGAKEKIRGFFPRYPTKRAVTIPALHIAQDEIGYVSLKAMRDIAELLDIPPSAVMDVVTFYTHFWTHPKGKKTLMVCRSISCQLMGADKLQAAIEQKLGVGDHGTTADGQYSFMTEECLAACDHAPCLMINEKMHKCVRPEDLDRLLADASNDKLDVPRSDLFDAPARAGE